MAGKPLALGRTVATPGALQVLCKYEVSPLSLLVRHQSGDWGELCPDDKAANERALTEGSRVFSAYPLGEERLWVITESDRSSTSILLPEEY